MDCHSYEVAVQEAAEEEQEDAPFGGALIALIGLFVKAQVVWVAYLAFS